LKENHEKPIGFPKRIIIATIVLTILLIAVGLVVFPPNWRISALTRRSPSVIYSVETTEPVVALTIDDGPDPVSTVKILDLLGRHQAKATFFLISQHVAGNEAIVRRSVSEGHELANHMTTDEPTIKLESAEFERQLVEAHQVLTRFSEVHWFRPGSGWYSEKMLSILGKYGYQCALGSVYPFDPQIPSAWFIRHYVLRKVRPGSIIVLHDGGSRGKRTIKVLTKILPEIKNRGFRLVTLSELVKKGR